MRTNVLRWNRLKKRAAALGVSVETLVKIDANQQCEPSQKAADEQREDIVPAAPDVGAY
jgi:hypothetical protein